MQKLNFLQIIKEKKQKEERLRKASIATLVASK
jgi:heme exporter protein D